MNTTQQVGGALGLAVLATLATSRTRRAAAPTATRPAAALTSGYQLAFAIAAGLSCSLALVVALVTLRPAPAAEEAAVEAAPAYSEV